LVAPHLRLFNDLGEASHPDVGRHALWMGRHVGQVVGADRFFVWTAEILSEDARSLTLKAPPMRHPRGSMLMLVDEAPVAVEEAPAVREPTVREEHIGDLIVASLPPPGVWSRMTPIRRAVNETLRAEGQPGVGHREWRSVIGMLHGTSLWRSGTRGLRRDRPRMIRA
jgi:hypothetical protein